MLLRALLGGFTTFRKKRMAWSNWLLEGSYPTENLQKFQKVRVSTIRPALFGKGMNVNGIFPQSIGKHQEWEYKTSQHSLISTGIHPSVPIEVLHVHFLLPSFLFGFYSFQFIFCVIWRVLYLSIYLSILADNERRTWKWFLFLYRDVPSDNIVWIQAGNVQKHPISLARNQDAK